jgi:Nucleotidyl transferase AbiEii toxin, Type IV TA system
VWVVWALAALSGSSIGEHLVFKGGMSLSKAYGVIRRFSEDVDFTHSIRALAPDLVGDVGEALPKSRSEEKRWWAEIRRRLAGWVQGVVQPLLASALGAQKLSAALRGGGR